ncbi:GNAT family N-acetyltransferase [Nocardia sp. alder85J]|uniref:GNAT family N-acetyltransferase n=1 Tax=Nocardia sp. alder85J TaxID=2862949 RepID=UPI001CD6345A|nr:GNAT family N-acetyltransferase [Nocardia sp. alder85J]MCX4093020.1 GNAT family N-acetyltransferase [Nocardia sp. alder85J]
MNIRIRQASPADLGVICRLRLQRTAWLAARGSDQWSEPAGGLPIQVFARGVARSLRAGETWMAEAGGEPAGTITVNDRADEGLWSPGELVDALIVHYMIADLRFTGWGIGASLLAHAAALARARRRTWVRLDAWTTNTALHDYYRRAGFRLVRIAESVAAPSTALFERRADAPDRVPEPPRIPRRILIGATDTRLAVPGVASSAPG